VPQWTVAELSRGLEKDLPLMSRSEAPGSKNPLGATPQGGVSLGRAHFYLGCLIVGYIGIYLCRKNLSVAIPLMQADLGISRQELGRVASISTMAYALGKLVFGPIIDRTGGRLCFLVSLAMVALFGGAGAFAAHLPLFTLCYSGNRFCGAAGWGAMVKLVPDWFEERRLAMAMALLSLSFVFGGVCASVLAGLISKWSGGSWRAVMGGPSLVLGFVLLGCALLLPRPAPAAVDTQGASTKAMTWARVTHILQVPKFWIVCALSFTLTLMRETFNTWTVDFIKTEGGVGTSNHIAAFLSTPFDLVGAAGILLLGWVFTHVHHRARSWLLFAMLMVLTLVLTFLPDFFKVGLWLVTAAVGVVGFLVYGPYSLLAGLLAVEIRGKEYAATVACLVDAAGYLAGYLAGEYFGKIIDFGGYRFGFQCLALTTFCSAILCLFLYPPAPRTKPESGGDESSTLGRRVG